MSHQARNADFVIMLHVFVNRCIWFIHFKNAPNSAKCCSDFPCLTRSSINIDDLYTSKMVQIAQNAVQSFHLTRARQQIYINYILQKGSAHHYFPACFFGFIASVFFSVLLLLKNKRTNTITTSLRPVTHSWL